MAFISHRSFREPAESVSVGVDDCAVRTHRDCDDVFLYFDCIFLFALAVEELLKPSYLVINNLALCFQFGVEDHVSIFISHQRHRSLAKRIDVNAEALAALGCASICWRILVTMER